LKLIGDAMDDQSVMMIRKWFGTYTCETPISLRFENGVIEPIQDLFKYESFSYALIQTAKILFFLPGDFGVLLIYGFGISNLIGICETPPAGTISFIIAFIFWIFVFKKFSKTASGN
jgi:hypothetical protein